jgi:hypothetical protein
MMVPVGAARTSGRAEKAPAVLWGRVNRTAKSANANRKRNAEERRTGNVGRVNGMKRLLEWSEIGK